MTATFSLFGMEFIALNAGPLFKFNESISFVVNCDTQAEIDYYREKLAADGGQPGPCGWLKDKFGLSWQIVPSQAISLCWGTADPAASGRAAAAMMQMRKLIIADLEKAYAGN